MTLYRRIWLPCCLAALASLAVVARAEAPLAGYMDYAAMRARLEKLDRASDVVSLRSLGTTLGGREVLLVTLAHGKPESKPALLVVGNVYGAHLVGSELIVRMAERLAADNADGQRHHLLDRVTVYAIPRVSPDAAESLFGKLRLERDMNDRPTDDDRDAELDEDPAEDLNGDGLITMMRVEEPGGDMLPHADDPRVLIKADPAKHERGRYKVYLEGRDNDGDELYNEDGPGGVAFNRNFPFGYAFFASGAGPHQVSEIETRAVADFAYAHGNIAAVLCFSLEDNLWQPWKPVAEGEKAGQKNLVARPDAPYLDRLAEQYRTGYGAKDAPPSATAQGSFARWAYFHFGRWSLCTRGWFVPAPAAGKPASTEKPEQAAARAKEPAEKEKPGDKSAEKPAEKAAEKAADDRGRTEVATLAWLTQRGIDAFVPWKAVDDPDFPGKKVEVGGFRPGALLNPPASELDALARTHLDFVDRLASSLPRIEIAEVNEDDLGRGLFRVTAKVLNAGDLPTMAAMGKQSEQPQPLQLAIEMPEGARLFGQPARVKIEPLAGGETAKHAWLVQMPKAKPQVITVKVWSPSVGSDSKTITLGKRKR